MPKRPPKGDLPATRAEYDASPNKAVGIVVKHKPPMRGTAAAATGDSAKAKLTKTKGERYDPRWPNPQVGKGKPVKGARGKRITLAENPKMGEPKVTSNNIAPKVTQKWKDKK